ncbi:histone PARylation factor 1 [Parasteatoda tepidariorum]|uniref:histone PARylation factor 1 n=1 Tax=Parasteatoda tepidariorum TaxID=114398 RepID=UPI001C71D75E|nr:histone PARylation factor 1 [Parasteatoda tepidariorum]
MSAVAKKRKMNSDLPLCKYGADCYRKSSDHRKKFHHPRTNKELQTSTSEDTTQKELEKNMKISSKAKKGESNDVLDGKIEAEQALPEVDKSEFKFVETVEEVLNNMPKDFSDFWKFCCTLNKAKPEEAFADLGLHLVGVYDILSRKLPKNKIVLLHCHWRYYYDPPEFQTVLTVDGNDLYHIGYFRDDPKELPSVLASNSAKLGPKLTVMGDNIFAAVNFEITEAIKKSKDKKMAAKFKGMQDKLKKFAAEEKYSLDIQSQKIKARNKKIVSKTFHGLGIVVPVVNDIGYRPLPDSDATIKNILRRIASAEDESKRLDEEEKLDELISNVQFANDECDYGMGLELGIDLFCFGDPYFHSHISHLLPLAYNLLKREKYAEIIKAHLQKRKKSGLFNELDT